MRCIYCAFWYKNNDNMQRTLIARVTVTQNTLHIVNTPSYQTGLCIESQIKKSGLHMSWKAFWTRRKKPSSLVTGRSWRGYIRTWGKGLRFCKDSKRRKPEAELQQTNMRGRVAQDEGNTELKVKENLQAGEGRRAKPVQQVSNSEQLPPQPPTTSLPPMFTPYHPIPCCFYPPQWSLQTLDPHLEIAPPVTTGQVRRQLDTLHPVEAPAPNGTSPRLMEGVLSPAVLCPEKAFSTQTWNRTFSVEDVLPVSRAKEDNRCWPKPVPLTSQAIQVLETLYSPTWRHTCCSWCSCTFFDFSRAFSILQESRGWGLWIHHLLDYRLPDR